MLEEILKIASGEANAESPHVVVPLYMPLAPPMSLADACKTVNKGVRDRVARGDAGFVALANGQMHPPGEEPFPKQLVLLFGKFHDEDAKDYMVFDTLEGDFEEAIMMDGDGRRYSHNRLNAGKPLPAEEALKLWMAGFLNWNENVPGLYRFRYCLVQG
jgi:hypothetical protein